MTVIAPRALQVLRTGPLALLEDLGRPGLSQLGVCPSGAADRRAHLLANRLLANPDGAATIEVALGGLAVRALGGDLEIAVTGTDASPEVDGRPVGLNSVRRLRDGQTVTLGAPIAGMRSYLAVRGGVETPEVLGSRSYDTLSGIGPRPLRIGDVLPIGPNPDPQPHLELAPAPPPPTDPVALRVVRGPRADWLTDPDRLVREHWAVSDRSDRIGVRLHGTALGHVDPDRQLPSEGLVRGAIQIPPDGQPVILGADHPVTGGYPVVGVLLDEDTDALAQLRPGQTLRLRWATGHS